MASAIIIRWHFKGINHGSVCNIHGGVPEGNYSFLYISSFQPIFFCFNTVGERASPSVTVVYLHECAVLQAISGSLQGSLPASPAPVCPLDLFFALHRNTHIRTYGLNDSWKHPYFLFLLDFSISKTLRGLCHPSLPHNVVPASPLFFMVQRPWPCLGSTQKFRLSAGGPFPPLTWASSLSQCIQDLLRKPSRLAPMCGSNTVYRLLMWLSLYIYLCNALVSVCLSPPPLHWKLYVRRKLSCLPVCPFWEGAE